MRTEKDNKKVKILGIKYSVKIVPRDTEKKLIENGWGACSNRGTSEILLEQETYNTKKREDEVLRHEVLHAYFGQAGFLTYNNDEALLDALSVLIPKMNKTFKKLDCLE